MTISQFHAQCSFNALPFNDGYLIVATYNPTGETASAFAFAAGYREEAAVKLAKMVFGRKSPSPAGHE